MKKIISSSLILSLILMLGFFVLEPESAKGADDTITVTQEVTAEVTISTPLDVSMSPDIAGISGGTSTGSATWNVKTNNSTGFNMSVKASGTPALASGGNNFADYTRAGVPPDYSWSIANTDSEFGFTVEPDTAADAVAAFLDNGSDTCGTGSTDTADRCWSGFNGTTDVPVINRTTITTASGEDEVVKFQAQSGSSHFQASGTYTATITATALAN
jgi:hypothetical protein